MAKHYSVYEAKAMLSAILRRVRERGKTVVVSYHGRPIAEIRPVAGATDEPLAERIVRLTESGVLVPARAKGGLKRVRRRPGALDRFLADREG